MFHYDCCCVLLIAHQVNHVLIPVFFLSVFMQGLATLRLKVGFFLISWMNSCEISQLMYCAWVNLSLLFSPLYDWLNLKHICVMTRAELHSYSHSFNKLTRFFLGWVNYQDVKSHVPFCVFSLYKIWFIFCFVVCNIEFWFMST